MRTALLAVIALAAGGAAVPVSMAAASAPDPVTATAPGTAAPATQYRDPTQAAAASVSVTGTLTPVHTETGPEQYVLSLPGGVLVPVSLGRADEIEKPQAFTGDLAITNAVARGAEARGATVDEGDDIDATSPDGRHVLAAASTSSDPLPVQSATLRPQASSAERTAAATATSAHRLYVAIMTNRGSNESASSIADKTAAMRSYWTTNSDGVISSFTQPSATVSYATTTATAANHCGLSGDTSAVWNEAAAKFAGVDFSAAGNHLMVIAPASCASGAVGIGTIGASIRSGGRTIVTLGDTGVAVGVHELGHNLSLEHANAEQCASTCKTEEYWDLYSIMGLAVSGGSWTPDSLDTPYRVQTGIATAAEVPTVTASATVHLEPRGATSGVRGLLVTDPSTKVRYSVEYRSGTGRDATAFYAPGRRIGSYTYRPGVVIERIEGDYDSTTMMTFASGSTNVTSYLAGQSFSRGQVKIAVSSASPADGADVTVTLPGTTAPPSTSAPAPPSSSSPAPLPTDLPTGTPSPTDSPTSTPTGSPAPGTFDAGTPTVTGTPQVGQRLAVRPGTWTPQPQRYRVQWLADGRPIARATGATIVLGRWALGRRISVQVTGERQGYTTASRTSAATGAVAAGRFVSRHVRVTGRAKVGRVLVAATGNWSPRPSFTYRWYANGRVIAKATGRTLKVTRALRGKRIAVRITARQSGYRSTSKASARTATVR